MAGLRSEVRPSAERTRPVSVVELDSRVHHGQEAAQKAAQKAAHRPGNKKPPSRFAPSRGLGFQALLFGFACQQPKDLDPRKRRIRTPARARSSTRGLLVAHTTLYAAPPRL